MIDRLIKNIIEFKNPSVIGLDLDIAKIPACYKHFDRNSTVSDIAQIFISFGKDIIDTVAPYVPAIKPQMAFYEAYGSAGVHAFEETVAYAKTNGLFVIEDAKRNDIGNTAQAYADGHLGTVALHDGSRSAVYDVDFMTVSPFLGSESLKPFADICKKYRKGIFVLVKTSNVSAGEIQDARNTNGLTVSQMLAHDIAKHSKATVGKYGYSSIGAVVGATYPADARSLREIMPCSYFLVPGFGAQGADASDVMPCFDSRGLGAIVNSSRGILYSHMTDAERENCTKGEYLKQVENATVNMQKALYQALRETKQDLLY